MAIINGSDLLVYKKNPAGADNNVKQRVQLTFNGSSDTEVVTNLNTSGDDLTLGNLINAVTGGNISDVGMNLTDGNLFTLYDKIRSTFNGSSHYITVGTTFNNATQFDAGSKTLVIEYNFAGDVDGLFTITPIGSVTIADGTIDFAVIQEGKTNSTFDPVAFSTNATISITRDLRDITNKDSGGVSESLPGQKSFEITVDALEDLTADYELQSKIDELLAGTEVDIRFSQRITSGDDVCLQGTALVSSITANAGVEENLTYSATFTGTGSFEISAI